MYQTPLKNVVQDPTATGRDLKFTRHPSVESKFKRCLDILGSLVGLLILAIVFAPIAIAIKIDSPGPIFFTQERYGFQGRPFRMWKFRSMVNQAEKLKSFVKNEANGLIFKNKNDFRVTQVGHFLRRSSLDELPQFWNVLLGEMSLVGTRPPTADEVINYNQRHWERLNVKPGITGEWQVHGRSSVTNFEQIVDLDLRYQKKWSPLYDLLLIVQTFSVVLRRIGAF
ncbi:MAG: sugar transferase [Gloeotrichia echinulata IR180]|jgi:lipopolysaccharide/colanic/teichoic acid biosynthesis glycosyltransferase|nr:sugar transferase [Gloeotrichia echinulata DEX184]